MINEEQLKQMVESIVKESAKLLYDKLDENDRILESNFNKIELLEKSIYK